MTLAVPTTDREGSPWVNITISEVDPVLIHRLIIEGNVRQASVYIFTEQNTDISTDYISIDANVPLEFDPVEAFKVLIVFEEPNLQQDGTRPDNYDLTIQLFGCFGQGMIEKILVVYFIAYFIWMTLLPSQSGVKLVEQEFTRYIITHGRSL